MRKGLGLSEQAIRRIGRVVLAQDYAMDPASGDFIMPEGPSGVPTADTEGRLKALEDGLGNLQAQMQELQILGTGIADLQAQVQELQQSGGAAPGAGAGGQPAAPAPRKKRQPKQPQQPQQQAWQPTSWWDHFKQVVMPDQIPGAQQPGQYQESNPATQYVGSKRPR